MMRLAARRAGATLGLFFLFLAAFFLSCGGDSHTPLELSPVHTLTVDPEALVLTAVGDTHEVTVTARDADGRILTDEQFDWWISDEEVAALEDIRVEPSGEGRATVHAHGPGATTLRVEARGGKAASSGIAVRQEVTAVAVSPADTTFRSPGERIQFEAEAFDANGHPVYDWRRDFSWTSTDPDVVQVDAGGLALALAPGDAVVRASSGNVAGLAPVRVELPDGPYILSVSPDPMVERGTATVHGGNFSPDPSANHVTVGGLEAVVTAASPTELGIVVSAFDCLPARRVEVVVTSEGEESFPRSAPLHPDEAGLELAVGEPLVLDDPEAFCLRFDATSTAEAYLIGVQSTSEVASSLTPVTVVSVASELPAADATLAAPVRPIWSAARPGAGGALLPASRAAGRRRAHRAAESDLRARERRELLGGSGATGTARVRAGLRSLPLSRQLAEPSPGDVLTIRMPDLSGGDLCDDYLEVESVVREVGRWAVLLEDPENPVGGFDEEDWTSLGIELDLRIYPTAVEYFGQPTDLDENDRVLVLVSKEVNRTAPSTLGFVFAGDLFPRSECAASQEGEVFYGLAPDPEGEYGEPFDLQLARIYYPVVMAHELTHVIQFGQRLSAGSPLMESWMMEAQATLAEEVVGHFATGRSPGQNYGFDVAFNPDGADANDWYVDSFIDLALYYGFKTASSSVQEAPHACGWLWEDPSPCLGRSLWYGVGWSFLRWISDHYGPSYPGGEAGLHRALVAGDRVGFDNLGAVTGETKETLLAPWAAMLYVDDRVAGEDDRFALPSWNLFDIFVRLVQPARLQPQGHGFTDFTAAPSVRAGSSAYFRVGGNGRPSAAIRVRNELDEPLAEPVQVWIVRLE